MRGQVGLLEGSFFPHWHAVLHHWLGHAPNYDQVTAWYLQWKVRLLPQPCCCAVQTCCCAVQTCDLDALQVFSLQQLLSHPQHQHR